VIIDCDLPQDEIIHTGNEVALGHALSCLLNSVLDGLKASPEKKIRVGLKPCASHFEITIEGSCPNFTSTEAEGLFSIRNNLHGLEDGAGYGLVVSKDIVSRFGGEIVIDLAQPKRTFVMRFYSRAASLPQAA
jgi:two-component system C4-dicarboxylate transport sensor histidine kinase DctB